MTRSCFTQNPGEAPPPHPAGRCFPRILKVERGAAPSQIRLGYQRQSLIFHPDRFLSSPDPELRNDVNTVAKRIKEAYAVLRHPVKRTQYNQVLRGSGNKKGLRFTQETVGMEEEEESP